MDGNGQKNDEKSVKKPTLLVLFQRSIYLAKVMVVYIFSTRERR